MPPIREGEAGHLSPDAQRMVDALRYANYQSVGTAIGVTRSAVARWAKGRQVTPWNLSQVERLLGHQEAATADWERLLRTVDAIAERVGVSLDERAAIDAAYAAQSSPPDAGTPPHPEADDPAAPRHRDRRR